jgi:hypothetical protein
MLTQARLKELLHYNPDTGIFTNLTKRGSAVKIGGVAGYNCNGYIYIQIDYERYGAHRLAWLYVYGEFSKKFIDHINEIRVDNRIINLRLVTHQENSHNVSSPHIDNCSGYRGVSWHKGAKKWQVRIAINGRQKHLGVFNTVEQASEAYLVAKKELHPFWKEKVV